VPEEVGAAGGAGRRCRQGEDRKQEEKEGGALQWCSMTRSTRPYSVASSALMK
jgi:hypothetical protein